MGFRSTGVQNFRVCIEFADHRYNSVAATAQHVISVNWQYVKNMQKEGKVFIHFYKRFFVIFS